MEILSKSLDVPVDNMIYIGDEEKDIKTVKNAGCMSVLINRKSEYKDYGQDCEINSLTEISRLILMEVKLC